MTYFKKYWKAVLVVVVVVFFLLPANEGYNLYKRLLRQNKATKDSLIELSQIKQDSLLNIIENGQILSKILETKINDLNKSNRYLYRKLKQREKDLTIIDTSFIINANRISNRSYRHRKENDTTQ